MGASNTKNKCPKCRSFNFKKLSTKKYQCKKCGYIWHFPLLSDMNQDGKKNYIFIMGSNSVDNCDHEIDVLNYREYIFANNENFTKEEPNKINNNFLINIKFFNIENKIRYPIKDLSGLINLCLMKYVAEFFDNVELLNKLSTEIKSIIIKLRNNINFTEDNKTNIYNLLKEKKGNNILIYAQYLDMVLNTKKIKDIINLLNEEKKEKLYTYWGCLSNYEEYSSFFEQELIKDLKMTKFDYSLISLGILEKNDELYKMNKNKCPNMQKRILYHGSQIDPISKILTTEFKYAKKPFYGMGVYFSDIIDYIGFYCGGTDHKNRRDNFGKIIPINSTFSFIGCEVFYDKKKFKQIKDNSLYVDELNHFPSYEELKDNYSDKMVEPNGIHFIRVDNEGESLSESIFLKEKKKGVFLGNEYAITEMHQILPLYSLTVKRNEYFVLWRDPNFEGDNVFNEYLLERKLFCMEKANMNIYFESSMEEALKFILRRKCNKIILITSIGLDLSGKKFIEIARKILEFDVMVLFFSANNDHLKWIQNFQNCLYTDQSDIYEEYITNFNETGLKNLRIYIEKEYKIKLQEFSSDFLSYPNFKNNDEYSSLIVEPFNPYIRHVKIFCKNKNKYLSFNDNTNEVNDNIWDVTLLGDEITLKNNNFYLDLDKDNENITRCQFMKIWKFKKIDESYVFININKKDNNILSMETDKILVNKSKEGKNELFQLIDVLED